MIINLHDAFCFLQTGYKHNRAYYTDNFYVHVGFALPRPSNDRIFLPQECFYRNY